MSYSIPLWAYGDVLDKARGWTCARCGVPLPEPHYTLVCKKCREQDELGYGNPEALEQAITREEEADFEVYAEGLCHASVCSNLNSTEVVARMRRRPCGTTNGWIPSKAAAFSTGQPNPCPCELHPATHKHYLFDA